MKFYQKLLGLTLGALATFSLAHPALVEASDANAAMQEAREKNMLNRTSEWQNTPGFSRTDGAIDTSILRQKDLETLSHIVAEADDFHGNVFYGKVATEHVLVQPGKDDRDDPIRTFLGSDGILQIANRSTYITDDIVQVAVDYWNKLAGAPIMAFVSDTADSDEVIHDMASIPGSNTLMAQSYLGDGIICYPENFKQGSYTDEEFNNQKASTVIHELGHALGVSHMGGGDSGDNAGVLDENLQPAYWSEDFMSTWAPRRNPEGVTSTHIDAAALTIVGMAWEKPRQVAAWSLKFDQSSLTLYDYKIVPESNTIPTGISINDPNNLITEEVLTLPLTKNYNVYGTEKMDQAFADKEKYGQVNREGTTDALGLIGEPFYITKDYTAHNGIHVYRGKTAENKEYLINAAAFTSLELPVDLPEWGVQVDGQILQDVEPHYETVTKNYIVFEENLNVPELMAEHHYYYMNKAVSTTEEMGLLGQSTLVLKNYKTENGIEINKVSLDNKIYYIFKAAYSEKEIQDILAFSQEV